jgi:hypothetical protein
MMSPPTRRSSPASRKSSRKGLNLCAVPEGPAPFVFIVGLPRSGTTLLERMLSNLPGVVSHGETDHFAQSLLGAAPRRADLDVFARAALADPAAVGRAYAARAARRMAPA